MNDNHTPIEETEESFEAMFEQTYKEPSRMEPGQKIEADIVNITPEYAYLQVGGKGEGLLDRKELVDAEGNLLVKAGDRVRAYFLFSQNGEMHFTTKIGTGPAARAQLEDACRNHIAVEGAVSREMKGGFEITLNGGARAFCPFSQMGMRRGDNTADYIGSALPFFVLECTERNVVLSRREIIEKERKEKILELKKSLAEGQRVKGTVTSIQNFGAFVEIGGIEGLLPVSEMAWNRTEKVSDLLSVGQPVEVIIKRLDWENEKVSLSLKDTLPNPWDSAVQAYPAGSYHTGTISRLAPFGAFVTLAPGVDGLIHISRLGGERRIQHPEEVVKVGQTIEVRIEAVNRANNRISLVPADVSREADEVAATMKQYQQGPAQEAPLGSMGEMLKIQLAKKAKQQGK